MQHYTTIEQSKKLVKLGLNFNTADMCYIQHFDESYNEVTFIEENPILTHTIDAIDLPCWSLGALIDIMPSVIYKSAECAASLSIYKNSMYHVSYRTSSGIDETWFSKESLIDAAFEMVCWLIENNYIKKGE